MGQVLTALAVRNIRATSKREIADGGCRGLYLVVHPTGHKSWCVRYRRPLTGKSAKLTLGPVLLVGMDAPGGEPEVGTPLSLAAARELASRAMRLRKSGIDPQSVMSKQQRITAGKAETAAAKFLSFIEQGIVPACYLYRHYHPSGDLLYVGVSLEVFKRQYAHIRGAKWQDQIHRIVIEPFATREEALAAEQAAIATEFPKYNVIHNAAAPVARGIGELHR
jgi:Arm DNA-binding domain